MPEPCNGVIPNEDPNSSHVPEPEPEPEPESPVAHVIDRFEDLSAPQAEISNDDEFWPRVKKKRKGKKEKRSTPSWRSGEAPIEGSAPQASTELNIHAQIYALADKYGIHDLKDLAREKFADAASNAWDDSGFPLAVQTVYSSTPEGDDGLRDVVVDTLSRHRELLEKVEVETLVKGVNGLAYGLLRSAWRIGDD